MMMAMMMVMAVDDDGDCWWWWWWWYFSPTFLKRDDDDDDVGNESWSTNRLKIQLCFAFPWQKGVLQQRVDYNFKKMNVNFVDTYSLFVCKTNISCGEKWQFMWGMDGLSQLNLFGGDFRPLTMYYITLYYIVKGLFDDDAQVAWTSRKPKEFRQRREWRRRWW